MSVDREPRIEIGDLVLGLPDVDQADVPALVDDVLRRLQDRLRDHRGGELAIARVTVDLAPGADHEALIGAVVDRLVEALR